MVKAYYLGKTRISPLMSANFTLRVLKGFVISSLPFSGPLNSFVNGTQTQSGIKYSSSLTLKA